MIYSAVESLNYKCTFISNSKQKSSKRQVDISTGMVQLKFWYFCFYNIFQSGRISLKDILYKFLLYLSQRKIHLKKSTFTIIFLKINIIKKKIQILRPTNGQTYENVFVSIHIRAIQVRSTINCSHTQNLLRNTRMMRVSRPNRVRACVCAIRLLILLLLLLYDARLYLLNVKLVTYVC